MNNSLLVHKKELNKIQLTETPKPELENGDVLLQIDKYAFTTNNITYGVVGHTIGYWKFFPAEEPYGIIPVWGFADVVESKHEGVKVGERFYGYFPMSTFLKVKVGKNNPFGFFAADEHRVELPKIYNYYPNINSDVSYDKSQEDYAPILRPLFTTSFLNYHFLKDNDCFGATQIAITSASSKTGLGLAYLLKKNKDEHGKKIIGLTSSRNIDFVKNTGYYDEVITYPDVENKFPNEATTIVDMAGNSKLLLSVSALLEDKLKFVSLIGYTDWSAEKEFKKVPNSKFFFAPTFAQIKYQEWGVEKTNQIIAEQLSIFTKEASEWLTIEFIDDNNDLTRLYLEMLQGKVDPSKGNIVKIK